MDRHFALQFIQFPIGINKCRFVILTSLILLASTSFGQTWRWGRAPTNGSEAWAVAADPFGNSIVAGVNSNDLPDTFGIHIVPYAFDSITGVQSVIAKYDSAGNCIWALGTQNNKCFTEIINITCDRFGNIFLLGNFRAGLNMYTSDTMLASFQLGAFTVTNPFKSQLQYFLAKIAPDGTVLWLKNDGSSIGTLTGFTFNIYITSLGGVATDSAGNCYITSSFHEPSITIGGHTLTNPAPGAENNDFFVAKYDTSGNVVWAKSFGGNDTDEAYGITVTPSGAVYITGAFYSSSLAFGSTTLTNTMAHKPATFIVRLDTSGNPVWAAGGKYYSYGAALASDTSGNVYLTGGIAGAVLKFDTSTIVNQTPTSQSAYLVKFDPSNKVSWYKDIFVAGGGYTPADSAVYVTGCAVASTPGGNVWITGGIHYTSVDIEGDTVHVLFGGLTYFDPIFISGYNTHGCHLGHSILLSGGDDQDGIACDYAGNVFIGGDYDLDTLTVGADTILSHHSHEEIMYIAKFTPAPIIGDTVVHDSTIAHFTDSVRLSGANGYNQYIWNDGLNSQTHTFHSGGIYWVQCIDYCTYTMLVDTFNVKPRTEVIVFRKELIGIYPNPAANELTIENAPMGAVVKLFNTCGQMIYSTTVFKAIQEIDLHRYSPGAYLLQIVDADGNQLNKTMLHN